MRERKRCEGVPARTVEPLVRRAGRASTRFGYPSELPRGKNAPRGRPGGEEINDDGGSVRRHCERPCGGRYSPPREEGGGAGRGGGATDRGAGAGAGAR